MMKFIRWLTFIKIVLQVVKRLKKIVIRKRRLKKILIKKERLKKIAKNIHVSNKQTFHENLFLQKRKKIRETRKN